MLCIVLVLFGMLILLLAGKRSPVRLRYSPPINTKLQEFLTLEAFFICMQFARLHPIAFLLGSRFPFSSFLYFFIPEGKRIG